MTDKALPRDVNNTPVQTLELGTAVSKIAVATASANTALPTGCVAGDIVRVACNTDCYFVFGNSGSVAADSNDSLFTVGVEIMQVPKGSTHIAAIRESSDGKMTITEVF